MIRIVRAAYSLSRTSEPSHTSLGRTNDRESLSRYVTPIFQHTTLTHYQPVITPVRWKLQSGCRTGRRSWRFTVSSKKKNTETYSTTCCEFATHNSTNRSNHRWTNNYNHETAAWRKPNQYHCHHHWDSTIHHNDDWNIDRHHNWNHQRNNNADHNWNNNTNHNPNNNRNNNWNNNGDHDWNHYRNYNADHNRNYNPNNNRNNNWNNNRNNNWNNNADHNWNNNTNHNTNHNPNNNPNNNRDHDWNNNWNNNWDDDRDVNNFVCSLMMCSLHAASDCGAANSEEAICGRWYW